MRIVGMLDQQPLTTFKKIRYVFPIRPGTKLSDEALISRAKIKWRKSIHKQSETNLLLRNHLIGLDWYIEAKLL